MTCTDSIRSSEPGVRAQAVWFTASTVLNIPASTEMCSLGQHSSPQPMEQRKISFNTKRLSRLDKTTKRENTMNELRQTHSRKNNTVIRIMKSQNQTYWGGYRADGRIPNIQVSKAATGKLRSVVAHLVRVDRTLENTVPESLGLTSGEAG